METAKVFENGRSQAVRLPKKFRFTTDEVVVQRLGPYENVGYEYLYLYDKAKAH